MKKIFYIIFACLLLTSCATKTVIEYRDKIVDHYITKVEKDTFIQKVTDSVYYEVFTKGDTVYATKYKERLKYVDRIVLKSDTCWRDSVVTEYKESVKEIIKIPKIYKYSLVFSILVIIFAAYKVYRWLR